jgi:hypothetical protein
VIAPTIKFHCGYCEGDGRGGGEIRCAAASLVATVVMLERNSGSSSNSVGTPAVAREPWILPVSRE